MASRSGLSPVTSDGPYTETNEVLGGFFLLAPSERGRWHLLRRSRTSADRAAPVDDADELTETTSGDDHPDGAPGGRQPVSCMRDVAVAPAHDA